MPNNPLFDDPNFQDLLIRILGTDLASLRKCYDLLHPDDFKPLRGMKWGRARWIYAEQALQHFKKYHEPAGKLIYSIVLDYGRRLSFGDRQLTELKEYGEHLKGLKTINPDSITDQVITFKKERLKAKAIEELTDLLGMNQLSDEKWMEITQKVIHPTSEITVSNYLEELDARIDRRRLSLRTVRKPWTFIDPLDNLVHAIARKQLGLVLAPYGRGKSLFLLWLAFAYVYQHLNVLYITLEDSKDDVTDRLDSLITHIPMKELINPDLEELSVKRFKQFRRFIRTNLKIVDGTEGGMSIDGIEKLVLQERDSGFDVDAVIIDYDDEIVPPVRHKDRRFEFSDIYRSMRVMGARRNLFLWTASQSQRDTEQLKIISGDKAAEDISKLRKCTMAIGLGRGDWGDESLFLWVAKHKFDHQHLGVNIVPDFKRMMIYDRAATYRAAKEYDNSDPDSGNFE